MKKKAERKRKTSILDRRLQVRLKELRHSRKPKYTQDDIASVVSEKWTHTQISQIETGRRGIEYEKLEKIAAFFKVDPGIFFQPTGLRRELVRSLMEGMPEECVVSLRGSPKYPRLLERLRGDIRKWGHGSGSEESPEEQTGSG
jgi:transcriptional regulator with XRE-family HTH domain